MLLNPVRLKLPTEVTDSAVTSGERLFIGQAIGPELLHDVYGAEIASNPEGVEKAFYMAAQNNSPLPSVQMLLLRNLRR